MNSKLIGKQKGMTLIEIMVALMLGAFLMAGVMQIFLSSKQTYRMQDNMSRMQENGRFAMEFISRDIRMADYWGCADSSTIESKLNMPNTYSAFANGLDGQNDDNGGNDGNDGDADNDENGNSIWDGADSITLRGATNEDVSVQAVPTTTAAVLMVNNSSSLAVNDVVIISNCIAGDMFQITNITGGGTNIIHNTGGSAVPGNNSQRLEAGPEPGPPAQPEANKYGPGSNIFKLNVIDYQIRLNGGEPSLFRRINGGVFQALIEGIENMQILYGEDTDADSTPNHYVTADLVTDMDQVVSTRVTLTVRSLDNNLTNNGDGRLRKTFSSTIVLRNRLN